MTHVRSRLVGAGALAVMLLGFGGLMTQTACAQVPPPGYGPGAYGPPVYGPPPPLPPPRYEIVPPPRPYWTWIPGHWVWGPGRYIWHPGHWRAARGHYRRY